MNPTKKNIPNTTRLKIEMMKAAKKLNMDPLELAITLRKKIQAREKK
jgi:hypothetical protein